MGGWGSQDGSHIVIWSLDKIKGGKKVFGCSSFFQGRASLSITTGTWRRLIEEHACVVGPAVASSDARAVSCVSSAGNWNSKSPLVRIQLFDRRDVHVRIYSSRRYAQISWKIELWWWMFVRLAFSPGELDFTVQSWARMQEEICNQKEQRNKLFLRSVVHDLDIWNQN